MALGGVGINHVCDVIQFNGTLPHRSVGFHMELLFNFPAKESTLGALHAAHHQCLQRLAGI